MRYLCTIIAVSNAQGDKDIMAISPGDDFWFVGPEQFSPELQELQKKTEASGNVVVLGAVFGKEV